MNYPTGDQLRLPWATWVPDRRPQFKVHQSLRLAKSAVGARQGLPVLRGGETHYPIRGGVVYQIAGDRWIVHAVLQPGTFQSEHPLFVASRNWSKQPRITTVIVEKPAY